MSSFHGSLVIGALLVVACGGEPSTTTDIVTSSSSTSSSSTSGAPTSGSTPSTSGSSTGSSTTGAASTTADASPSSTATPDNTSGQPLQPDLPACAPTTCVDAGKDCGALPDGCGRELDCGRCDGVDTCGGGGVDNVCGHPCVPVRAIFFDLGDTLVEPDGNDQFVERPGVTAMLAELTGLGMRVGVITNTPEGYTLQDLEDLLVNPDLLAAFELVLLSSEAASPPKPGPQIFNEAHGLLVDPPPIGQVAYVSENLAEIADDEQAPTQGARAAGMLGVHLSSAPPSPLADITLAPDNLGELVVLAETEWLACSG